VKLDRRLPLIAALLALAGCSTGQPTAMQSPQQAGQLRYASRRPVQQTEHGIAYATDRPRAQFQTPDDDENPTSTRPDARHAALIGLYGELMSRPNVGGRFDGAGNLAQITAVTEGACFDPDVDPDGRFMAFASTQHGLTADIFIKSTNGKTQTRITSDPADDVMPAVAPDGKRIAFASNRSGNWDIYITTTDGGPPIQFTSDAEHELHPTWSPDGEKLAYCKFGAQSGRWELWVADVNNPAAPHFLEYGLFPQWNPDPARNKIVFQRARERGSRLFSIWTIDCINGEGLHPTEIISAANAAAMHPAWSPDGARIVFVTVIQPDDLEGDRPVQSDLWAINVDGTNKTNLTNGRFLNLYPTWAADGTIYFLSDRSGADNIWAVATGRTMDLQPTREGGLATADPDSGGGDERP
jgi:TolB protein